MIRRIALSVIIVAFVVLGIVACGGAAAEPTPEPGAGIANPASVYCAEQGGESRIETGPGGGQYGVCVFDDNRQCEEWSMFRGDCPVGGVKVAGYVTDAARFCAISGGIYDITANTSAPDEQGTCTFNNGVVCDAAAFYAGECARE